MILTERDENHEISSTMLSMLVSQNNGSVQAQKKIVKNKNKMKKKKYARGQKVSNAMWDRKCGVMFLKESLFNEA